jgi:hypothetical protein
MAAVENFNVPKICPLCDAVSGRFVGSVERKTRNWLKFRPILPIFAFPREKC